MKVPADVDQLMWFLAESGDEAAITEFRKRYPDFEIELIRRQSVVRGLKDARPGDSNAPVFKPREGSFDHLPTPPARWPWVVGGVALAGLAMASYVATSNMIQRKPTPPLVIESHEPSATNDTRPRFETPGPNSGMNPNKVQGIPDENPNRQPEVPPVRENNLRPWEAPQTVALEEAPLHAVLSAVASQCGMQVEIAPNTPNPNVASIRFDGISGVQMLKELGRSFGFTPLEQEPGRFLIIPTSNFSDVN